MMMMAMMMAMITMGHIARAIGSHLLFTVERKCHPEANPNDPIDVSREVEIRITNYN